MKPLCIFLAASLLLFGAACEDLSPSSDQVDDSEPIAAIAQKVTKDELEELGYTCESVTAGWDECTKCVNVGTEEEICSKYWCSGGLCKKMSFGSSDDFNYWFEAEDGTLTAPMQTQSSSGASAGAAVAASSAASSGGAVSFTFDVPQGGATLYLWARVRAPSTAANALEYRIDAQSKKLWTTPVTGSGWSWSPVHDAATPAGTGIELTGGTHKLRFYGEEAGTLLDRVLLTNSPTFEPIADTYQAEDSGTVAPMQVGSTSSWPQTGYTWVPNGAGTGGLVRIEAVVPAAGKYAVWGRANAPTGADDSFFVSTNLGEPVSWDLPTTSASGWKWSLVAHEPGSTEPYLFDMNESHAFIDFEQQEDGAKLDRIIVTNDPGFVPVDGGAGTIGNGPVKGTFLP